MKNKKVAIPAIIGVAIIAILIVVLCIANSGIKLNNYINSDLSYEGFEGYAHASTNPYDVVDMKQMYSDLTGNKLSDGDDFFGLSDAYVFEQAVSVDVVDSQNENLKNGDKIKLKITINKESVNSLNNLKKKLKGKDEIVKSYEVKGLEKIQEVDLFDAVKGVYIDPEEKRESLFETDYTKTVYIDIDESYSFKVGENTYSVKTTDFGNTAFVSPNGENYGIGISIAPELSSLDNYKAGDKMKVNITIKTGNDDPESFVAEKGFKVVKTEKEYTISQAKTIKSVNQFSNDDLKYFKSNADKLIEKYMEDQDNKNYTFEGMYFDYNADGHSGPENEVYVFYNVIYNRQKSCVFATFKNLRCASDGRIINPSKNTGTSYLYSDLSDWIENNPSCKKINYQQ